MLGSRLKQHLAALADRVPQIADFRGLGFTVAAEFGEKDGQASHPNFANAVKFEAVKRGLILLTYGVHGNVIRFWAPLTIPDGIFRAIASCVKAQ